MKRREFIALPEAKSHQKWSRQKHPGGTPPAGVDRFQPLPQHLGHNPLARPAAGFVPVANAQKRISA